jgi:hypothetical protein
MVEADQSYHSQIVRTIIAIALREARKEIKRTIRREGKVKVCRVPAREIARMAEGLVEANPAEFIAKAKASSVVQEEIQRLRSKEERKRRPQLERNSKHLSNSRKPAAQRLPLKACHAQNGAAK